MQDKVCLFCLEEVKEQEQMRNLIGCNCELLCHAKCMQNWFETKGNLECPVCHAVSLPNFLFQRQGQTIQIIHVNASAATAHIAELERKKWQEKCAMCCCFTFLFWAIVGNVLTYF